MLLETYFCALVVALSIPILIILIRVLLVSPFTRLPKHIIKRSSIKHLTGKHVSIFLGSGGHTGEMLKLTSKLNFSNFERTWIYSSEDTASQHRARHEERQRYKNENGRYIQIPRARTVGQSYVSSIPTTLFSIVISAIKLARHNPDVILLNGPGTCIPIAYMLFLFKLLGLNYTKIIYVESLARVKKLSLSGRLIMPITDRFIVQWDTLYNQYSRAEFYGMLM
ncbi:Alg14 protein [Candida orthopsilosis Co 90-125]|uniref:UDP-N-acetylglucosamine transferase subunit ALG14 n=1 Tax=Candida orthopsilosis (strain 90-125) TaxID=1136231 RepID=H8X4D8_CANO9|nr:Alg14 protein [Candida orthopsilosis Co 90-125]CCG26090.1 Alg14 protein [Candida orthopsilosis Co 90-125]